MEFLQFSVFFLIFTFIDVSFEFLENPSERILKYEAVEYPDHKLSFLTRLSDVDHLIATTEKILIPRIVGTPGHDQVRDYIKSTMEKLNWHVELDSFEDKVPINNETKTLKFENIIATLNPNAKRYLVLACHYDSKLIPNVTFLGATDSAVPCAMLINLAKVMETYLNIAASSSSKNDNNIKNTKDDLSLMFIFFDGEEAFTEWGPNDSIYGARHLAKKWNDEGLLNRIDILVLLDLIGAPNPKFYSFFRNTEKWFVKFVTIEEKLAKNGFLENYTTSGAIRKFPNRYFQPQSANSYIEDDHIPFLKLGVPILHLITVPFPKFWHTVEDDADAINYPTVENINKILRIFVAEYLQIDV